MRSPNDAHRRSRAWPPFSHWQYQERLCGSRPTVGKMAQALEHMQSVSHTQVGWSHRCRKKHLPNSAGTKHLTPRHPLGSTSTLRKVCTSTVLSHWPGGPQSSPIRSAHSSLCWYDSAQSRRTRAAERPSAFGCRRPPRGDEPADSPARCDFPSQGMARITAAAGCTKHEVCYRYVCASEKKTRL